MPFVILVCLFPFPLLTPSQEVPSLEIWVLLKRNRSLKLQLMEPGDQSLTAFTFYLLCVGSHHFHWWQPGSLQCCPGEGDWLLESLCFCLQTCLCPATVAYLVLPQSGWTSTDSLSPLRVHPVLQSPVSLFLLDWGRWVWGRLIASLGSRHRPRSYLPTFWSTSGWKSPQCSGVMCRDTFVQLWMTN